MNIKMSLRTTLLFGLLVATGFVGALYFRSQLIADDETRSGQIPDNEAVRAAERNKPRFSGEIGGIFLAPRGTPVPEKYTSFESVCGPDPLSVALSDDQAGSFALTLDLSEEYIFQPDDMDTGVYACENGIVVLAKKAYAYKNGGFVTIGRSVITHNEIDIAFDRPKVMKIAGRDVVVIEPLTEDGFWENGSAWISEPFGGTFVSAHNFSRDEFIKLVELVASSTRTQ